MLPHKIRTFPNPMGEVTIFPNDDALIAWNEGKGRFFIMPMSQKNEEFEISFYSKSGYRGRNRMYAFRIYHTPIYNPRFHKAYPDTLGMVFGWALVDLLYQRIY